MKSAIHIGADTDYRQLWMRAGYRNAKDVSQAIGCSPSVITDLSNGRYGAMPRATMIKLMASIFDCTERQVYNAIERSIKARKFNEAMETFNPAPAPVQMKIPSIEDIQAQIAEILGRLADLETQLAQLRRAGNVEARAA